MVSLCVMLGKTWRGLRWRESWVGLQGWGENWFLEAKLWFVHAPTLLMAFKAKGRQARGLCLELFG